VNFGRVVGKCWEAVWYLGCRVVVAAAIFAVALVGAVRLPHIHRSMLRSYVGSRVVHVTSLAEDYGGTGVYIKAESGKSYILTNHHICAHALSQGSNGMKVYRNDDDKDGSMTEIIKSDPIPDLCVLAPIDGTEGLRMGAPSEPGSALWIVGHPRRLPLTVTSGDLVQVASYDLFLGMLRDDEEAARCRADGNEVNENKEMSEALKDRLGVDMKIMACRRSITTYKTSAQVMPGSSGSPIVGATGTVHGIIAKYYGEAFWGWAVGYQEIEKILQGL
jgi:hypothetical protein